ncbi:dihydrodipicolinate synthetase [Coniochaeta sp. 2T2.1]|nr:dihydrodipicolinate synthetase [Coniochaeta sp. 2T2.1]
MSPRVPPPGVYVPSPTFYRPSSEAAASSLLQPQVDVQAQADHSVFLAKSGIKGLIILGSTGEAIHLNRSERKALVAGTRKGIEDAGFPDYPILAGVLTNGIDETLEWLNDYKEAGAQWGLVLVPGYFGTGASQENIREWFTIIADNSPLPILIYNYPGVTNNVLVTPETYTSLAAHPNIVGCKMSHGNVSHHVQVSLDPNIDHDNFRVFSGFGQQLGPIVVFGAAGVIDGLAAIYPKTVVALFNAVAKVNEGDKEALKEARRLQYVVSKAEEFIGKTGVVGIKDAVYRVTGLGENEGGRLPLKGRLEDGQWEALRGQYLDDIEAEEKNL